MHPYINEQFNGYIWRMEIDELSDTIFVEIRNNEEKKVCFSSINLGSGKVNFKDLSTPERWLTGIEAAYAGVLLLYNYQSETSPAHKGLIAIDAVTGKILWTNYNYALDHLSVYGPVIFDTRIQPLKLFVANIKTGATIRPCKPSDHKDLENNILLPDRILPSLLPFSLPLPPIENIVHHLKFNNFIIVSLHTLMDKKLTQLLYIMDGVSQVFKDILNTDIQKIQPEAFIMHNNRLVYIKNKTELKVLSL